MKVALDLDLNYQTQAHPLAQSLLTLIAWSSLGSPLAKYGPIRALVLHYHSKIMNRIIGKELHDRREENQKALQAKGQRRSKSIISLTLEDYAKEGRNINSQAGKLDDHFASFATYQLRLFLFAGHDTVTRVLVYIYHLLYKHPDTLKRIRQERGDVFGQDPSESASRLRKNPKLLNQTPYTLAVIKESMRLFPLADSLRDGSSNTSLVDRHEARYPTNDFLVSLSHHSIHRNPNTWVRTEEFLPERWTVEPGHELYPQLMHSGHLNWGLGCASDRISP
ncbi:cytochrome P450 [Phaeosphaeriaceae sp. PMI808]|nr:cytochrome P450 [Phaeosphaeriaceae sp. PMI808]